MGFWCWCANHIQVGCMVQWYHLCKGMLYKSSWLGDFSYLIFFLFPDGSCSLFPSHWMHKIFQSQSFSRILYNHWTLVHNDALLLCKAYWFIRTLNSYFSGQQVCDFFIVIRIYFINQAVKKAYYDATITAERERFLKGFLLILLKDIVQCCKNMKYFDF